MASADGDDSVGEEKQICGQSSYPCPGNENITFLISADFGAFN